MKKSILFLFGFLLLASSAYAVTAKADIKNAAGEVIGAAMLSEQPEGGVAIDLTVSGLTPGEHGIHIHENGKCDPPDFKSAGGHFNPTGKHHGFSNPEGHHSGDLPNLTVGADGKVSGRIVAKDVTLNPGPNSLLKEGGTSLVIHAGPDDEKTDPAGNSGARVACGVITANP